MICVIVSATFNIICRLLIFLINIILFFYMSSPLILMYFNFLCELSTISGHWILDSENIIRENNFQTSTRVTGSLTSQCFSIMLSQSKTWDFSILLFIVLGLKPQGKSYRKGRNLPDWYFQGQYASIGTTKIPLRVIARYF